MPRHRHPIRPPARATAYGSHRPMWQGRQVWLWVGLALLGLMALIVTFAPSSQAHVKPGVLRGEPIEIPDDLGLQLHALAQAERRALPLMSSTQIQAGDDLISVFQRLGIRDPLAQRFIEDDLRAQRLLEMRPNRWLIAANHPDGRLLWLKYLHTPVVGASEQALQSAVTRSSAATRRGHEPIQDKMIRSGNLAAGLLIERVGNAFQAIDQVFSNERSLALRAVEVRGSLFATMDAADIPESITLQLIDIFGGVLDFYHDVRRGDRIRLVYETYHHQGMALGAGKVIAVQMNLSGRRHEAYWFDNLDDASRGGGYYNGQGQALRKSMLRMPVAFTRISSGFSENRLHPILGYSRAHLGVDFAAPVGTGINAVADGVITSLGYDGSYGQRIEIQHAGKLSTLYAHLSAYAPNLRQGDRVQQGQLIGYVGQTGLATGPHLHYEIKIAGVAQDPETIQAQTLAPISGIAYDHFRLQHQHWRTRLLDLQTVAQASLADF